MFLLGRIPQRSRQGVVAVYPKILTLLHINIFSLPCLLQLQNLDETQRMNHSSEPEESEVEFLFFLGMDNSYLAAS